MPRPSDAITIHTTRDRLDALSRFLDRQYLGYVKDDGKVREFLKDADRARQEKADVRAGS